MEFNYIAAIDNMPDGYTKNRFRGFYTKKMQNHRAECSEIASCPMEQFKSTVMDLLGEASVSTARNVKAGMIQYLRAAEQIEGAVQTEEKARFLENIKNAEIATIQKQHGPSREKGRHFFVTPEHLRDELLRYNDDAPNNMQILMMLEWMGIPGEQAVELPKSVLAGDCTTLRFHERDVPVPPPFQPLFFRYRECPYAVYPRLEDPKDKVQGDYLIAETYRPREKTNSHRKQVPVKMITIFREVMVFNEILNDGKPRDDWSVLYGVDTAGISGFLYRQSCVLKDNPRLTPELLFKDLFDGDPHTRRRWLDRWYLYEKYREGFPQYTD